MGARRRRGRSRSTWRRRPRRPRRTRSPRPDIPAGRLRWPAVTRIAHLLAEGRCFSFEFFPPKTEDAHAQLQPTLLELAPLGLSFVSITYGAGGTTRERTHDLVVDILRSTEMTPMAHLCCAGHAQDELRTILTRYRDEGVDNILALR